MVPVRARDVAPVAWRLASEFARPDRTTPPSRVLAVTMAPMFAIFAILPGTFHWEHRVVLAVQRRPDRRLALGLLAGLVAVCGVPVARLWFPSAVPTLVLAVLAVVLLVVLLAGAAGLLLARERTRRLQPPAVRTAQGPSPGRVRSVPRAGWVVALAASAPGMDAMDTCFEPLLRRVVPAGETVAVRAANQHLADVYRTRGFVQAGGHPLKLSLTLVADHG